MAHPPAQRSSAFKSSAVAAMALAMAMTMAPLTLGVAHANDDPCQQVPHYVVVAGPAAVVTWQYKCRVGACYDSIPIDVREAGPAAIDKWQQDCRDNIPAPS